MNIQLQKKAVSIFAKILIVIAAISVFAISGILLCGKNTDHGSGDKGLNGSHIV